jgi:hypothetical protein
MKKMNTTLQKKIKIRLLVHVLAAVFVGSVDVRRSFEGKWGFCKEATIYLLSTVLSVAYTP